MWFATREISTLLAERGFSFACTSYTNAWAEAASKLDLADPIGSAAYSYTYIILNQDLCNRRGILTRLAREYSCDGAVLHSDRSCKPYSVGQVDLKEQLIKEMGIKVLLLESDHNDPRAWASEPGANRLTAFMESFA
jgi:benzoyl-CoA reductase/2-hydroxyglutaryl-CoA dehydratase subunit BcrC/BadD/HgdB